jgi:hypothetical protein
MDEAEWLACTDPARMLEFLRGKVGGRKLRLLVVAWGRDAAPLLRCDYGRLALEAAERHADSAATHEELVAALARVSRTPQDAEASAADPFLHASRYCPAVAGLVARSGLVFLGLCAPVNQAALICEVIGNPFRPAAADPAWLAWNDRTVRKIAQAIYEERAFDRMPILADALEESGCDNPDLLGHLRGNGPHVRGCWAVDWALGKE